MKKPSIAARSRLRQGRVFGLNPNVFFLSLVSFLAMLGIMALVKEWDFSYPYVAVIRANLY